MRAQLLILAVVLSNTVLAQTFTNYTTTDGLASNNVLCLDVGNSDEIWFGTQSGISVFDGTNWSNYNNASDPGIVDDNIQAIRVMSNGDVWAGTDFGACYFDGNSWTTFTTSDGLGNDQIKCIEEDALGNVWLGTNSGASFYDGNNWTNIGTSDGLPFGGVIAISFDSNGDALLGSGLGGVAIYNNTVGTILTETSNGLVDNRIRGIRLEANGNKWIGTSEGISVLDASNNNIGYHTQMYTLPAPDTLNPIEDLEIDNSGNIWVGVYVDYLVTEGGVCAYDGNSWTEYHVADGLVGPVVRALAIDSENSVWVATSSGVSKISDHQVSLKETVADQFIMYPNPAKDKVMITSEEVTVGTDISLYNASMQLVAIQKLSTAGSISFSVSELPGGLYFVQLNGVLQKLIVE